MNEIKDLVEISKYAGERFDLVQAGGGNSSVKFDNDEMIIKASGFLLSDVNENSGYSRVKTSQIANIVKNNQILNSEDKRERESITSNLVKIATIDKENRPSIETLLHSFLYKYTLHTHPIVVNMIVIQKNWKEILKVIFKEKSIALVEYKTPGIELALELDKTLQNFKEIPNIIFLQNHGLIITSEEKDEIKTIKEEVLSKIENYLKLNMSVYKLSNYISNLFRNIEENENISYLSEDIYINKQVVENQELFYSTPFCPDSLVYCGISCAKIENLSDTSALINYKNKYFELPKVILYQKNIFFRASSIKKAKEMEEVFKFHIMVLEQNIKNEKNFLELNELAYLLNWEAEKYRQKL
ncbi:class II aldolase/adducin family protein [Aliarcobacter cryaerophilus]|uniref:class II aldolase/adducin family protein n=1 Tax=Aliarcobacter cryaerophilus TaxID=28198 RepID=UPI0021B3FE6E|nr:class II aldolase/adducin family protein [Aliarcobacter cryaerophilus]MCT7433178.1 class II aldolase/adducin family protein [Aliarcobacter cryaerophilus]